MTAVASETRFARSGAAGWRRLLVAVLVVVGCLLAPISVLGLWARNTVLETDQYVDTVGPLVDDPAIQEALATRVQERLFEAIDVETEVADALPPAADFVVPFVADGLERFVHDATLRFVSSHEFERLWDGINRRAHAQVLAVLEGEGTETVQTRDGKVVLELDPLVDRVKERLSDLGVDVFDESTGERLPSEFVLFESESLRSAQSGVRLIDRIAFALPMFTLLLFAVAIWLSPNRRRTGLRAALGVVLAMVLVLTGFNLGRHTYLDAVENAGRDPDAAAALYDQVLRLLRLALRTAAVLGLVIAVGLWLAGPGRLATRIRRNVTGLVRSRGEGESTTVGRFVATNRTPLRVLVIGAGLLVLVVLSHPGPVGVLVVAGLVVVGLLVIEFLARGSPKPVEPIG